MVTELYIMRHLVMSQKLLSCWLRLGLTLMPVTDDTRHHYMLPLIKVISV